MRLLGQTAHSTQGTTLPAGLRRSLTVAFCAHAAAAASTKASWSNTQYEKGPAPPTAMSSL
eukprot:3396847-Pyramimonas_sp.AAC.1